MKTAVSSVAVAMLLVPTLAFGQQFGIQKGDVSGLFGVREWITTGNNEWNFDGDFQITGGPLVHPNVLSDLRWRGVDSLVTEFYGELFQKRQGRVRSLGLLVSVAFGGINEGELIDDDFATNDRQFRFSHTSSTVKGDEMFRATVDVAGRAFEWETPLIGGKHGSGRGYVDVTLGYQYWHEQYEAFGAAGSACPDAEFLFSPTEYLQCLAFVGVSVSSDTKVITHDYWWHALRVGVRTEIPLMERLSFKAGAIGLPYVLYEMEDVHHLRTDLRQDPSFSAESNGWGFELDAAVAYRLWKGLSAEAGYRYSRIDSGEGDKFTYGLTATVKDKLNNTTFERYGPHASLSYRW